MTDPFNNILNFEESKTRSKVIDHAVKIEYLMGIMLSNVLGCEPKSISFGSTSSALSFMTKINLLTDVGLMITEDKKKLKAFAEIRNQFAHNLKINDTNTLPDDIKKQLKSFNNVSQKIEDIENFEPLYDNLYNDVKIIIIELIQNVTTKAIKIGEGLVNHSVNRNLIYELTIYAEENPAFQELFNKMTLKAIEEYEKNPISDEVIRKIPIR